jgi:hypothetical protein
MTGQNERPFIGQQAEIVEIETSERSCKTVMLANRGIVQMARWNIAGGAGASNGSPGAGGDGRGNALSAAGVHFQTGHP